MKSNKEISFRISLPSSTPFYVPSKPNYIHIEGKKYLLFFLFSSNKSKYKNSQNLFDELFFLFMDKPYTWLIVADDNSEFVKQLKNLKNRKDFFSTSFTNLKFKPDFLDIASCVPGNGPPHFCNGLLVKDNSKIKRVVTKPKSPEINFKVVKVQRLRGKASLELEIEPLDLGIEDFPKINFIIFLFSTPSSLRAGTELDERKYEALFSNSVGKNFIMKVNEWTFGKWNNETGKYTNGPNFLSFHSEEGLEEIKEQNVESEDNSRKIPDKSQEIPSPKPINSSDPLKAKVEVQNIIINLLMNHSEIVLEFEQSNHLWKGYNSWQDKLISLVNIDQIRTFSDEMQNYIWQIICNHNNSPNKFSENGKLKPILIFGGISMSLIFLIIFVFHMRYKKHKNIKKVWVKN